jgi:hypothetical protein
MLTVKQPALSKRRTSRVLAGLLFLLLFAGVSWAEIIPASRTAPWQGNVGVPGGIPNRTRIYKNIVTDLGADPKGATDCSSIIQDAINKCPKDQVVYIPEGTYKFAGTIGTFKKNNYTLRGAGQGKTILKQTGGANISIRGDTPWPPPDNSSWIPISAGATKGSNTITVADTAKFAPEMMMAIGPSALPTWAHNLGNVSDTQRTLGVTFKVRSKTATTVTFDPPCPFDFSAMTPMAVSFGGSLAQGVGLESFTVQVAPGSTIQSVLYFESVYGCWVKDVELYNAYSRQMYFYNAVRCEVRRCYTHDVQAAGPNHEGIDLNTNSSWNWVEDNICNKGGAPPIEFSDAGQLTACNVASYNYVINTDPGFWDISFNHGRSSMLNLAEGNIIHKFEDDGYFGSSSHGTLLRNSIDDMVLLKHFSNYYSVVGNILGARAAIPPQVRVYDTEVSNYWSSNQFPVYELGYPNIGNPSHNGKFLGPTTPPNYQGLSNTLDGTQQLDRNVRATLIRHGNYDYANKAVIWDPNISDRVIPDSLLYSSKPSWWDNSPWPPIGSDKNPMVGTIPAQNRMLGVSSTPAPTATVPPTTAPRPSATPSSTQSPQAKKWKKKVKTGKWGRAKKNSGNQMPEGQEDISH